MIDIESRKAQLTTRLRDLEARLRAIGAELESHQSRDWEDLATEREEDEVLETMGLTARQEMRRIAAALDRIETGDYGVCVRCGRAIAPERLDLLPDTPFCRDCAAGGRT